MIGVALFAQWSVLSNVTAGVILFFSPAYRIGNYIRILDKDMPTEAKIEDIFAFYTHLRTRDGELQIFPNNLLLQKAIQIMEDPAETENLV
ncbi:MAG: mechanosensitive ion channel family protein [Bacteroidales bacterium]|nr:mechanosensitive ion channel family protein [Bacteroidales bacterium]